MQTRQMMLEGGRTKPYTDGSLLRILYEKQEKSVDEVADICGCSETTVRCYMRWFGIECRNGTDREPSPAWFGTRSDGYEYWKVGQHTVYVHRLVAVSECHAETARWIGRPAAWHSPWTSVRDRFNSRGRQECSQTVNIPTQRLGRGNPTTLVVWRMSMPPTYRTQHSVS